MGERLILLPTLPLQLPQSDCRSTAFSSSSTNCKAQHIIIIITLPSSLLELMPPCLSSSNSKCTCPLCHLCCRLLHPLPTMAGCCELGRWGWTSLTLSLPLGLSLSSSLSPCPPQQRSIGQRCSREEEDFVAIALALTQCHCHGEEGQTDWARTGFLYHCCQLFQCLWLLFCNNSASYQKNNNWQSSVHVLLNSTCADNCQLMNKSSSTAGMRSEFCNHGGGHFYGVKKLDAVCCSSVLFLVTQDAVRPSKIEHASCQNKKYGGNE